MTWTLMALPTVVAQQEESFILRWPSYNEPVIRGFDLGEAAKMLENRPLFSNPRKGDLLMLHRVGQSC